MEGVHDCHGVGELFGGGGLEAGEPVIRDDLHTVAPGLWSPGEPLLEGLLRAAFDHVQEPGWAGAVTDGLEVDDHRHVLVPASLVALHVLIDPEDPDAVEPGLVADEDPLAFGQDGLVGGVPCDTESFSDAGDGEMLAHDAFQRPPRSTA